MVNEFSLYNHYKLHADLMFNKVLSLTEIYELLPFERELYSNFWNEFVENKKNKG